MKQDMREILRDLERSEEIEEREFNRHMKRVFDDVRAEREWDLYSASQGLPSWYSGMTPQSGGSDVTDRLSEASTDC